MQGNKFDKNFTCIGNLLKILAKISLPPKYSGQNIFCLNVTPVANFIPEFQLQLPNVVCMERR